MVEKQKRSDTYFDQLLRKIKNNKIFAIVIMLGVLVTAVATFKENIDKLFPGIYKKIGEDIGEHNNAPIEFAGLTWLKHGRGYVSPSKDIAEVNDVLVLGTHNGELLLWSKRAVNLDQISFTVECELISQDQPKGWGLVFWVEDFQNFYYFSINNKGQFRLIQFQNGNPNVLKPWTASPLVAEGAGKAQRLGIQTSGQQIRLLVGNEVLTEHFVSTPSTGSVGFYVERRGLTVNYRDLRFQRK